ncbi:MAG: tRNA 2-selenouridine(34) synthase MnmH [Planctomycetota bacterium]|jgi:tRNA 2-selenouridine synthase|nr:tRNA 2-selenouridine(34) synthase MnmH [Planctomycetota bacterium]MDP6940909.1 tRNA 2-selenouridine(34) synthase MnmH [Planctomycetota bacterium]
MNIPSLSFEDARTLSGLRVVDVRSPAEFEDDHIPGAINFPLFENDQRTIVGTLYKQESPEAAYREGLALAKERIGGMLEEILGAPVPRKEWLPKFQKLTPLVQSIVAERAEFSFVSKNPILIHCWRGGMRSCAVIALLRELGHSHVFHLQDGYRGYRSWVRRVLHRFDPATPLVVLRGPTGVGKTRLLRGLEKKNPGSTLDLEDCAGHRSSVLGAIGLNPKSQKSFDSSLAHRLLEMGPPPWFVEGESRKVGDSIIPRTIFQAMEAGSSVRIEASDSFRVNVLGEDYASTREHLKRVRDRLPFFKERLEAKWTGKLQLWLDQGEWPKVAHALLEHYYDPLYRRSDGQREWLACVNAESEGVLDELEAIRGGTLASFR